MPPTWIDHLVFAAPTLDDGIAAVRAALGATPVAGGAHPGRGTHNALLSLGPPTYLEVIAPDPAQAPSTAPAPFGLDTLDGVPRLVAFAVGCADIDATVAALRERGRADVGSPFAMSRRRPDGSELSWRLAMIGEGPAGPTPFLISWDGGASPADDSPRAGRLVELRAGHPEPRAAAELLAALAVDVSVEVATTERLEATIESDTGLVTLA
jgi:hypothetical protein